MNEPRFERYFVFNKAGEKKWKWRARAANGEIVATCGRQTYATKQMATKTIDLFRGLTFANAPVVDTPAGNAANRGPRVARRT